MNRQGGDIAEIEISPAMIKAGVNCYLEFWDESDSVDQFVELVFQRMLEAAHSSPTDRID